MKLRRIYTSKILNEYEGVTVLVGMQVGHGVVVVR